MKLSEMPVSEAQVEKAVCDLFLLHGWEVNVMREDIHTGSRGVPDLMVVSRYGLVLFLEIKRPAQRDRAGRLRKPYVRKAQKARLMRWRLRFVPCCVVDSVDDVRTLVTLRLHADRDDALRECDRIMVWYDWWPV